MAGNYVKTTARGYGQHQCFVSNAHTTTIYISINYNPYSCKTHYTYHILSLDSDEFLIISIPSRTTYPETFDQHFGAIHVRTATSITYLGAEISLEASENQKEFQKLR